MRRNNKRKIVLQRLNLVRFCIKSESYFYRTWCACRSQCSCTDQKGKNRIKRTSPILLCIHAAVQAPKLNKYRYLSISLPIYCIDIQIPQLKHRQTSEISNHFCSKIAQRQLSHATKLFLLADCSALSKQKRHEQQYSNTVNYKWITI